MEIKKPKKPRSYVVLSANVDMDTAKMMYAISLEEETTRSLLYSTFIEDGITRYLKTRGETPRMLLDRHKELIKQKYEDMPSA